MSAFPDITPASMNVGSRYRAVPLWGPRSVLSRGGAQFTAFRKFRRPRYAFELAWTHLELATAREIAQHITDQHVTLLPFDWFDWYPFWWRSVFVGIGDGATTQWVLPAKDVTDVTIYVGGATSAGGTDRTFIGGNQLFRIGPNFEDGVSLFAPPALGRPIWAYFRGRRRWNVTIEADMQGAMTRDLETGTYAVSMRLMQTKPAPAGVV
ncbi:MAG TPA: hypothetical protein VF761_17220 [Gemmatimonadaceae bacterium]